MEKQQQVYTSILVIGINGLHRIYCPFKAICITDIDVYSIGEKVSVIALRMENNSTVEYIINDKVLPHTYFQILNKEDR